MSARLEGHQAVVAGRTPATAHRASPRVVRRSGLPRFSVPLLGVAVVGVLGTFPLFGSQANTALLVNVFALLTMAVTWNLLAGYAGMISIGQQAFVGLGAYGVLIFAMNGVPTFASVPIAAVAAAVAALPISLVVFRLRGGYFAIATWVVSDATMLIISSIAAIGGGTGHIVPGLSGFSPHAFGEYTYWSGLVIVVLAVAGTYGLLRSRLGLVLAAVRDDEIGARSAGARVDLARRIVFVVAALGCGAAGALLAVSQLQVQAGAVFSVQWAAEMIFVTLIGGIGTVEGPILGTIIFFVLQQNLASYGAWYLIIFGSLAVVIAIWAPRGLWGPVERRFGLSLFPLTHRVEAPPVAQEPISAPTASTGSPRS